MPEFFLELFSEEIPARMQKDAAATLEAICTTALGALRISEVETWHGPRRIAIGATLEAMTAGKQVEERGPREGAPEAALTGFLGKHKALREDVVVEGGYFWLRRNEPPVAARDLIATALPPALMKFPWPKSMRWGQSGDFTWVRPLRRMICLFDGQVVPIRLGPVTAGNETEGHRFLAPGAFEVSSAADWEAKLRARFVFANEDVRGQNIQTDLESLARDQELTLVADPGLMAEVNGLVEWPVGLIGKIDEDFMELPPEVRELSMKMNQRYFALRDAAGKPAPYFAFVANMEAEDGGAAIVAGNERVLRARLSDARHFWDLDLKTPLKDLLPKLARITFHAKIGTQLERSERISKIAFRIAQEINTVVVNRDTYASEDAEWAGRLCKADLVTGMVNEFPELQGIIGGYYAKENGWVREIPSAIASHYQPKGPSDEVPRGIVPIAVALADKIDSLNEFFRIGETPTGSGDPYALRRAALGVSRTILENNIDLKLGDFIPDQNVFEFILERLKIKLKSEGKRYDVMAAAVASVKSQNLLKIMMLVNVISKSLLSEEGKNFLAIYKRASNLLRAEDEKDGPHRGDHETNLFRQPAEMHLADELNRRDDQIKTNMCDGDYSGAMHDCLRLREPMENFLLKVTVNELPRELRLNRLKLLARFRDTVNQIADFSKIEG